MSDELERELPPGLRGRVLAAARQSPSPPRSSVRLRSAVLTFTAFAVPLGIFVAVGGVERGPRSWTLVALIAAGLWLLSAAAMGGALGRSGRTLGPPRAWLVAIAIACPVLFTLWKLLWSAAFGGMMVSWPTRPGLRCFALSLLVGLWPLMAFTLARRGSDPVHPRSLGAAIGAACGVWAGALVDLWCPVGYPSHVLFGHVLPILLLASTGALLGLRLLGLRTR